MSLINYSINICHLQQKVISMNQRNSAFLRPFDKIEYSVSKSNSINEPFFEGTVPIRERREQTKQNKKLLYALKDLSSGSINKFSQQNYKKSIFSMFGSVSPQSNFALIWNLTIQISIVYVFLMIPIVIFFGQEAFKFDTGLQSYGGFVVNIIICILFFADIILRFNLGYYQNQRLIMSRKLIFINYIQLQFWLDLVSTVILVIYLAGKVQALAYVKVIFYIKIYSLYKINETVRKVLQGSKASTIIYEFLKLLVITWFLNTWSASIFFAMDYSSYLQPDDRYFPDFLWLTNSQLINGSLIDLYPDQWYIWYQYALYWSVQTGATTGYGSLTGKNPKEIVFSNFIMFFMTVYFAYFINSVWQIINSVQQSEEYNEKWDDLKLYIKQLPLSFEQKRKINNYMIEVFKDNEKKDVEEFIVANVPSQIKDQFYVSSRQKFYLSGNYFSFLSNNPHSAKTLIKLAYQIQDERYAGEDVIYEQNHIDPSLYYIQRGYVKLELRLSPSNLYKYGKIINDVHFGMEQFICRTPRRHRATAATFVKVWKLKYEEMRTIFKSDIENNAIFFQQEQSLLLEMKPVNNLGTKCLKCSQSDHFFHNCRQINYLNKEEINQIEMKEKHQGFKAERIPYKRSNKKENINRKIYKIYNMDSKYHNVDKVQNYNNYHIKQNIDYSRKYISPVL